MVPFIDLVVIFQPASPIIFALGDWVFIKTICVHYTEHQGKNKQ